MPTTSVGLFRDYLPAPQICKSFSAPPSFCETHPEHFDRALADGKVSTNVHLRRIHNHALGMEWLLKSVIPRLQWPKPVFKDKRAIAQQALGHNSKAVHRAYVKHVEVTVPSLDDWEKEWEKNSQRDAQPKLLPVDFQSPLAAAAQSN